MFHQLFESMFHCLLVLVFFCVTFDEYISLVLNSYVVFSLLPSVWFCHHWSPPSAGNRCGVQSLGLPGPPSVGWSMAESPSLVNHPTEGVLGLPLQDRYWAMVGPSSNHNASALVGLVPVCVIACSSEGRLDGHSIFGPLVYLHISLLLL